MSNSNTMTANSNGCAAIRDAFVGHKAFIPFITCGDPDLETTKKIVKELAEAGSDIIELGVPFSDPTAEGPVIQAANVRALSNHVTLEKIFDMVVELRSEGINTPMVFMTYANVVFHYGIERFAAKSVEVGMNGLILPDVPFEERNEFAETFEKYGLAFISLIAPTSKERIAEIAQAAEGFIYLVSSLGVTGMRSKITTDLASIVASIRENTDLPIAIGFGISNPEQAEEMARIADGVIVGSAIVNIIAEHGTDAPSHVLQFVDKMIAGTRRAQN